MCIDSGRSIFLLYIDLCLVMLLANIDSSRSNSVILVVTVACSLILALIHLYASKLKFLDTIPRSRWLSMASGVSVAYVFVHLLPDLNEQQKILTKSKVFGFLEHHVYLMALLSLAVFYGLERMVTRSQHQRTEGVYWLHIASFAVYNALIGYLLFHREESGLVSLLTYAIAMGLHFIVNDYGLNQDHSQTYRRSGRWILAAAIVVGSVIGWSTNISTAAIFVLFSFLAGGIILNILK